MAKYSERQAINEGGRERKERVGLGKGGSRYILSQKEKKKRSRD